MLSAVRGLVTAAAALLLVAAGVSHGAADDAPIRDPDCVFQARPWTWKELHQQNVLMQQREYTCGAAAMATVMRYYWGDAVGEEQVLQALMKILTPDEVRDRVKNGLAISDLRRAAVEMGYEASIGTLSFEKLAGAKSPVVVPIRLRKYDHFVVVRGVVDGRVYLADPVRGNVRPTMDEFCSQWQKQAVLVVAKPDRDPPETSPLSVRCNEVLLLNTTRQAVRRQLEAPSLLPPAP
jgi:predicted double-glycine peptidase